MATPTPIVFGEFVLEPAARRLTRGTRDVHLTPKALELLLLLAEQPTTAVSKQQIFDRLWPGTFVAEANLAPLIFEVRAALGDSARQPRYLRTVHGFGYAFSPDAAGAAAVADRSFRVICGSREIVLNAGENVLGRSRHAAVWIDSRKVSRRHARIVIDGTTATIEDCGSRNGTFLRGQRIESRAPLSDGDEIKMGDARLVFRRLSDVDVTDLTDA